MSDAFPGFAAFDPAAVSEAMRRQFGWGDAEIRKAAEALLPAALAGIRHFGSSPSGFEALMALMPGPGRVTAPPPAAFVGEPLAFVFGPEEVRRKIARAVAEQTGLDLPGVETMMPVAATLALGQVARRFSFGPARDLLDAFLAGYARGRPKPVPNPLRMMAPYAEAMRSFWDGYLGLFSEAAAAAGHAAASTNPDAARSSSRIAAPEKPQERARQRSPASGAAGRQGGEAPPAEPLPEDAPVARPAAAGGLVDSWLELGRNIQDSQIRQFEALFERHSDKR